MTKPFAVLMPAISDICRRVCPNGIEPPLAQGKLAVESVDKIQPQAYDGHDAPNLNQGGVKIIDDVETD